MTPGEYRDAFKLKGDYPIVAPAYAAQRSTLAKSLGLGRKVGVKAPVKKTGIKGTAKKAVSAKATPKDYRSMFFLLGAML